LTFKKAHIKITFILLLVIGGLTLNSCSDYSKVLKGETYELKYERAYEYYKNAKYI